MAPGLEDFFHEAEEVYHGHRLPFDALMRRLGGRLPHQPDHRPASSSTNTGTCSRTMVSLSVIWNS